MHKYFFILGTHPHLSLAELASRDLLQNHFVGKDFCITKKKVEAAVAQKQLGGIVKVGEAHTKTSRDTFIDDACELISKTCDTTKKVFFGISVYGDGQMNIRKSALAIKKTLQKKGISSRWVQSQTKELSSVQVKTNKLLSNRGADITVLSSHLTMYVGKTQTVQEFDDFSARDYGRPARDARSGMLPPKLARIMINLARVPKKANILDPFCGSGTILQESLLLGYIHITGSDVSQKAIESSAQNTQWLSRQVKSPDISLFKADAAHLSQNIKPHSTDAIISEPYLGPPHPVFSKVHKELSELYIRAFKEFKKILKPSGCIVFIFPVIKKQYLSVLPLILKLGFTRDSFYSPYYDNKKRKSFLYGRSNQLVEREIFVFRPADHSLWQN